MGAGLSEEDDAGQERAPCNEGYLHWLLSDPSRVQEAFKPVWRACSTDEQGTAPKSAVLEVMLRVVAEFERSAETGGKAGAAGKTPRQLVRVVAMLPESLSRGEALHLFRTALLSVQASLVAAMPGQGTLADWPQSPVSAGSPVTDGVGGAQPDAGGLSAFGFGLAGLPSGPGFLGGEAPSETLNIQLQEPAGLNGSFVAATGSGAELVPSSRASTRAEDQATKIRIMRLHPAVKSATFSQPGVLPSREELDVENAMLRDLSERVEASARDELAVVHTLEEEIRASEASGDARRRRNPNAGDDTLFVALEAKADATEEEVRQLEFKVRAGDRELTECEAEVMGQQREIQALLAWRSEEEVTADELSREARDLTLEFKSCRRTCGSLESEIASEEARAAALRQAFEGRRARFTTAETAARNAELSTMRATRRRIAAEAAARREASTVEEAEHARQFAASNSEMKVEALMAEIQEVRLQGPRAQASSASAALASSRRNVTMQATASAEVAVASLRAELRQAEVERDSEVSAAHSSANEVAELEVARARLEGQLAGRESELHALHRRALRSGSASGAEPASSVLAASEDDELEARQIMATLEAIEMRTAGAKQRELEMCGELRLLTANRSSDDNRESLSEQELVDSAWARAREVGAELGEAHAALARRRAQDQSTSGGDVVAALKVTLQDAEKREAQRCAELAEVCDRVTASLAEQRGLQQWVSSLAEAHGSSDGSAAGRAARAPLSAVGRLGVLEGSAADGAARGGGAAWHNSPEQGSLLQQVKALERELIQKEGLLDRKLDSFSLLRGATPAALPVGTVHASPPLSPTGMDSSRRAPARGVGGSGLSRLAGKS